ncbi:V-set and immunoglobulin domain-containing protein 10-like [Girardinichthys multiradiatus]|uniref:V-set and immunoglobulin domain-containing protein 10-like n=1 Tax=Girardinichthys multiradiatus TaxID=208333 RepID=UPI001FAB4544|nr:V-set and immunoglobulin domain-containing protein 10-like [Girardinichthys multiradiatus]
MKWLEGFQKLSSVLFILTFQGANCQLAVFPIGPALVNALAGSNVTLAVSFRGAPDPVLTWFKGNLPVGTWTLNSNSPPDIANSSRDVLRIENNGSLTFKGVPKHFTGNYTVELTKSGLGQALVTFTLKIFESIQNVTLSTQPDFAQEGAERFTLQYSMLQGVVEQEIWYFNGGKLKNSTRYLIKGRSLVILEPSRTDKGSYSVLLMNPFSSVTTHMNVTVLYGPDEPIVEALPAQPFYKVGDSLVFSCQAEGFPKPTAEWVYMGQILSDFHQGVLNLTNVQTSQGGVYTCSVLNGLTEEKREKNVTLNVYERPLGNPVCSVMSVNNAHLQYLCVWAGGTPQARLSFPTLSNTSSVAGIFSFVVPASTNFDKRPVICIAEHPIEQNTCNITASSPINFLPAVKTIVDPDGKIAVTIQCVSEASPQAVVSWSRGDEGVINGSTYQISSNTTQLKIRSYNITTFLLTPNFTCTCHNPLGSKKKQVNLQGPSISDSSLFPNKEGTIITLTWEVPPTSIVTGFDIQMKGPDLLSNNGKNAMTTGSSNEYRIIQQKTGSARSADVFLLDPDSTYRFRIIPKARLTDGDPSEVHTIGPGEGLSGPAIAGIAAAIPCSILVLILLIGLIFLIFYLRKKKNHQTRYPVSRTVDKVKNIQPNATPRNILNGGLRSPPDYNRLQKTPPERSEILPTFVPPPTVRVATTV